jgi:hypothetical protein
MIINDLEDIQRGAKSVIVIDSQGDMIRNILRLGMLSPNQMGGIADRVVLIDPNDVENPPALNLFDFGLDRLKQYSALEREKMVSGAIALFEYIFGALLGAELTNRQGTLFSYLARLLMLVPGANIHTLIEFMENPETVTPYVEQLDDPSAQRFFATQFQSPMYATTRQQILSRLYGVLSKPVLSRMFSHEHNKLNLFEAMNNGSLILINTAKDLLRAEGCEIFGRFMIALISQATQERSAVTIGRRSTFAYIDEAKDYFGDDGVGMEELINQGRKFKVGITIAFQNLAQLDRKLQAAIFSSTAIKYAGGVSAQDAAVIGKEMNCDPDFIQQAQKTGKETQFAVFIRNQMQEAAGVTIPFGAMENWPKMAAADQEKLLADNRKRISGPVAKFRRLEVAGQPAGFTLDEPGGL